MRRTLLALPVVIFTLAGICFANSAAAQESKKARGTVTAMNATMVTVKVAGADMNFAVDDKTKVEAPGAGTATRRAAAAGKAGVKLGDVVKTGDAVEVSYQSLVARIRPGRRQDLGRQGHRREW